MGRNLIIVSFIFAAISGLWLHVSHYREVVDELAYTKAQIKAIVAERAEERTRQEATNNAVQKQADTERAINADLLRDIDRLRNRPKRVRTIIHPGAACQSATGAELSREDADFLSREAARADTIRTALIACYAYADGLQ